MEVKTLMMPPPPVEQPDEIRAWVRQPGEPEDLHGESTENIVKTGEMDLSHMTPEEIEQATELAEKMLAATRHCPRPKAIACAGSQ